MKTIFFITLSIIVLLSRLINAQVDNITCATQPIRGEVIDLQQNGGIFLTSQGELKVLVVFVKFRDDHSTHNYWPDTMNPQPFMTTYIDPTWQTNSTNEINLTHYFRKMSLGIFKVIGEYKYVETPQDKSYYGNPPNRWLATKDVIQLKVDPLINFANYDNWTCNGNYNQSNQPDGTVDMIVVIWRGQPFSSEWGGEASLGYINPNPPYENYYYVENGTKLIKTSLGCGIGSGVTVQDVANKWLKYNFHSSVHEMAHWLLGSSHPYDGNTISHRAWGMLRGGFDGICANAYERERVAWINPTAITGDILNAPFTDYVETGVAYKYHPTNGATNEYYYFENHQKLNIYCDATRNPNDKGIFVYHLERPYSNTDYNRCKTSNGQFNWNDPFTTSCFGSTLPAYKMISVNRNGYNNMDRIPKSGGGTELLYALINENGVAVCGGWPWGEGLKNSFDKFYNNVFSPKSNPNTNTWANQAISFTMEVFDQNGSTVNAKFYLTDPYAGKPSKPQWLQVQESQGHHPYLSWEANQEPDMLTGGKYNIYKKKYISGSWTWNYLAQTTNNYYEDATEDYCPPPPTQCENPNNIYYRVKAIDSQLKESVYSDSIKAVVNGSPPDKISVDPPTSEKPTEYSLMQNYPNPFNPATTISYSIQKAGEVNLKVYDMLGTEVANLVNEIQEAGNYFVEFNAANLSSGMYVYRLSTANFTDTKKLILLK